MVYVVLFRVVLCLLSLFGIILMSGQIIGGDIIEFTEGQQVRNLQFGPAVFDMAVSLLALVDDFPHLCLCQVMIFPQFPEAPSIIHAISPQEYGIVLLN